MVQVLHHCKLARLHLRTAARDEWCGLKIMYIGYFWNEYGDADLVAAYILGEIV